MADAIRVLYVDDEPSLLELGKIFLEKEVIFTVDILTSALEALERIKTEQYDAIISDYQMPEMDGITFLKQLKASGDATPFIIFTGRGREEVVIEALNEGADFYIQNTPTDGIPYWDTGAPGLLKMGDYLDQPGDPFNEFEPVDSSAAAIAAQGLVRLGNCLAEAGRLDKGKIYLQAGLTVSASLFQEPYLSVNPNHQGLILHSVYHRPNGWDHIPSGRKIPCGESTMWGDYHERELALQLRRIAKNEPYYTFFVK